MALVVTIVVLLIFAGVSINLVLGDNGIVKKAQEAKTKTEEDHKNIEKKMNSLTDEINNAIGEKKPVDLSKYSIGDYINYTYDVVGSGYTTPSTENGSSNQTIAQSTETLKWRILNIDEASGTVDLVSATPTSNPVTFYGILGYNNGPYVMDKICEALYSNNSLGIEARNAYKHNSNTAQYGTTKTYTGNKKYPSLYAGQKGAGPNITEADASTKITQPKTDTGNDPYEESKAIATTEPTNDSTDRKGNPLTVTQTYYNISIGSTNYGTAGDAMKSDNTFWVAARYVDTNSVYAEFGLHSASTNIYGNYVFYSNYHSGSSVSYGLRPVVSLPSSLLSDTKDDSGAWNLMQ